MPVADDVVQQDGGEAPFAVVDGRSKASQHGVDLVVLLLHGLVECLCSGIGVTVLSPCPVKALSNAFPDSLRTLSSIFLSSMSATTARAMFEGIKCSLVNCTSSLPLIFLTLAAVPRIGLPSG